MQQTAPALVGVSSAPPDKLPICEHWSNVTTVPGQCPEDLSRESDCFGSMPYAVMQVTRALAEHVIPGQQMHLIMPRNVDVHRTWHGTHLAMSTPTLSSLSG